MLWFDCVLGKKKRTITEGAMGRPQPQRIRYPLAVLFRMFVLGSVAVIAASYAIWRHYTVPPTPMLRPTPAPTEIEVEPPP